MGGKEGQVGKFSFFHHQSPPCFRSSSALLDVFRERETLLIQLGKILDVNMKFDSLKMLAPSIPNDIAYVKRQATLRRKDNRTTTVEPDQLGELSMFYIEHNPAMKSVIKTITDFFLTAESKSESLDLIVVFCKVKIVSHCTHLFNERPRQSL